MFKVVVLGGGPAGVTAALRARELGASVALIERSNLGGTCTNDGCVPTRVLAKAARLMRDSRQFEHYGLRLGSKPTVDFEQLIKRTQQVVYQIHEKKQLLDHLHDVDVTTFIGAGSAHFVDPHTLHLEDGSTVQSEKFILCVGGHPRRLPFPGSEFALTHSDVWTLNKLPEAVAIVGSGATGCQLASIFEALGTRVILLDIAPRILITEDILVAETVAQEFNKRNIELITGIETLVRLDQHDSVCDLIYKKAGVEQARQVNCVILSVGWPGNLEGLGLEAAGVEIERNYIKVNDQLQTSAPHIYAAGDITGKMMLVQSASYQARVAVENALLDEDRIAEHRLVPHGGFTDPEYGGVGMTEEQARKTHDCAVAVVPYKDVDRAVIDDHPVGFCKLIVDRETSRLLGAHVVGEQAVEVVQMVATGMAGGLTCDQLAELELAYPTFAAIIGLAARELCRELGCIPVVPSWRALKLRRGAEWERTKTYS